MKRYLVGGAVRDQLLGLTPRERDWLVTDTSIEELLSLGYQQVGRDFPVFLDPIAKEEHALPRGGSETLSTREQIEQDLIHRDLTTNAMALDENNRLIDPLNGRQDLEQRLLRHTPTLFDDPIRVLRLARFAARYARLGFQVAEETVIAVRDRVASGLLENLVAERVWKETERAILGPVPSHFFQTLRQLNALAVIFPELDRLFGVPQPKQHHPEIDTGLHVMMVLDRACELSDDGAIRFAALMHDLGKGTTPPEEWPRHIAHEKRGVKLVDQLCDRLRVPNEHRTLAKQVAEYHTRCHRALELKPGKVLKLLEVTGSLQRPERLDAFLTACQADMQGRTGFEQALYPQADYLRAMHKAAHQVETRGLISEDMSGEAIKQRITQARVHAIAAAKHQYEARD